MKQELQRNIQTSKELQSTYLIIQKTDYSPQQLRSLPANQVMIYAALRKGISGIQAHLAWLHEIETLTTKTLKPDSRDSIEADLPFTRYSLKWQQPIGYALQ